MPKQTSPCKKTQQIIKLVVCFHVNIAETCDQQNNHVVKIIMIILIKHQLIINYNKPVETCKAKKNKYIMIIPL